ncbi:hypothetical protein BU23DRAFT_15586 [Bimuria novae-zelandiae CBS 107.79]|uniref:Uncharacterized protein n=1 Tax=Bimuria novae-zelandiae CBS 107.79 TaxID=1447943 RepID=A0A6A5VI87_9PLEO|nr:hypothetical protein BU23DRAFT_15586 [Bimuria novae-zelandiae CBS 107.79]
MSRAVTKKEQQQHQAQQHKAEEQYARDVETEEHHSSASASFRFTCSPVYLTTSEQAGLNLNLFAALSGAFTSTKRKETHTAPDGSKHSIEDTHDKASGHAAGTGTAYAQGATHDSAKREKAREIGQARSQGKIKASQTHRVDHLGIEN